MPQSGGAFQELKRQQVQKKINKVRILKARVLNLVAVHSVRKVVFHVVLEKTLETLWHSTSAVYS